MLVYPKSTCWFKVNRKTICL